MFWVTASLGLECLTKVHVKIKRFRLSGPCEVVYQENCHFFVKRAGICVQSYYFKQALKQRPISIILPMKSDICYLFIGSVNFLDTTDTISLFNLLNILHSKLLEGYSYQQIPYFNDKMSKVVEAQLRHAISCGKIIDIISNYLENLFKKQQNM